MGISTAIFLLQSCSPAWNAAQTIIYDFGNAQWVQSGDEIINLSSQPVDIRFHHKVDNIIYLQKHPGDLLEAMCKSIST